MNSIATQISTINVPFHGDNLYLINHNGEAFTPMKPIVDGMGLAWAPQHEKLKQRFGSTITEIVIVAGDGKNRGMTCLALRKLAGWLHTINIGKVRPELREKVARYQEECDDVLYQYWTKGQASNPRKVKTLPGKISKDQQAAIKELVMSRGQVLPKEKQAKAMITMWSALKTHFGITYKEIEEGQFTEALSLVARLPLDGEFIGRQEAVSVVEKQFTDDEICSLAWLWLLADKMQQHASLTYPALKQLESRYAGEAHDLAKEFKYWLGQTMSILSRESARIEPSEKFACIDALNHLKDNQWKAALLAKH
ncbi:MAG: phage antirepressor N-terminal domain-containing protein [Buttiauxella gaviniae]